MARIALAGASDLVTHAGEVVAAEGGSVTDVVIAASLAAMCTDPGVCAPGGGGYLTIDLPGKPPVVIDGYMAFPGLGFDGDAFTRTVVMEYGGGVTTNVDAGSVAVPGAFAAFDTASRLYGRAPWKLLMDVVASIIDEGFPLSQTAATYLNEGATQIFDHDPAALDALFPGGKLARTGQTIRFDGLADTLREIGETGARSLYQGDLAERFVADLAERGGRLTRQDLAEYRPLVREPLSVAVAGSEIMTNPAPAVGGVALCLALASIAGSPDPLDPMAWFEALRDAFYARFEVLEPAVDREIVAQALLEYAGLKSPSTIAVAAVDEEGGAVAASFSAGYGSGVIPRGTGMLTNNSVGEIELLPGGIGAQAPGDRMLSNMAPCVVRGPNGVMALASPGATRITSALATTITRAALGGDDLVLAINHPRVHPERLNGEVRAAVEPGIDLVGRGIEIRAYPDLHMYFGGVAGAAVNGSEMSAHADPRRVGSAVVIG